ncbi:hypothetical protein Salat_0616700 [Sesamum alatum]|uniref:Uncharacterized protein n=1 Tax=Sesamum alatum TaxID=300844 RepID=A0AAE2CUF8_9LAMI|nr:hypothetical protein Salat_0616700 [Sesamum alatum]
MRSRVNERAWRRRQIRGKRWRSGASAIVAAQIWGHARGNSETRNRRRKSGGSGGGHRVGGGLTGHFNERDASVRGRNGGLARGLKRLQGWKKGSATSTPIAFSLLHYHY